MTIVSLFNYILLQYQQYYRKAPVVNLLTATQTYGKIENISPDLLV